jgi:hypothetical protein
MGKTLEPAMIPLYKTWLIQIEITNACTYKCANCTRFVGHHQKSYFMDLETIEKAVDSLDGFGGGIGIMGGEPTLHPQFPQICELLQKKVPPQKCGLWTSGYRWEEYKHLIKKTFKYAVSYNDHSDLRQKHQPVLVAIDDVIEDKKLMWNLIDHCWVQESWSPSINPKGAFFCEVAAALDIFMDGPGGYPVEKGWWIKDPADFRDQVERYCRRCGAALPMQCPSNREGPDLISPGNLSLFIKHGSPKILNGQYQLFNEKMDEKVKELQKDWTPSNYLGIRMGRLIRKLIPVRHIFLILGEFKRKKDFKLNEIWLLNRGTYNTRRVWVRIKRKLFEKKPSPDLFKSAGGKVTK